VVSMRAHFRWALMSIVFGKRLVVSRCLMFVVTRWIRSIDSSYMGRGGGVTVCSLESLVGHIGRGRII
jgi:hypothetical protein